MFYGNVLWLITAGRVYAKVFVGIAALDLQEAVCGVADTGRQNFLPQHGINNCTLAIACSIRIKFLIICDAKDVKIMKNRCLPSEKDDLHAVS